MEGCRGIVLGQNLCELCQLEEKQICHGNILRCAAFFAFLFVALKLRSCFSGVTSFGPCPSVGRLVVWLVGLSVIISWQGWQDASIGAHFLKYVCVVVGYVCQFVNCLQT